MELGTPCIFVVIGGQVVVAVVCVSDISYAGGKERCGLLFRNCCITLLSLLTLFWNILPFGPITCIASVEILSHRWKAIFS